MKMLLMSTLVVAALASTAISAFTATDKTEFDPQLTNTPVVSTPVPAGITFAKKTLYNSEGSIASVIETWADPETHDKRLDIWEPIKGSSTLQRTESAYVLGNGTKYIKATLDAQGNLKGSMFQCPKPCSNLVEGEKQDYVNEYKEGSRRAGWSDEGFQKDAGGRDLKKLSRTDISTMPPDNVSSIFIENVYLDKDSGLPVKGDISVKKNGVTSLVYTYIYVFDNIANDGSLFNTNGMDLEDISK